MRSPAITLLVVGAFVFGALAGPTAANATDPDTTAPHSSYAPPAWCTPPSPTFVAHGEPSGPGIASLSARVDGGATVTVTPPAPMAGPPITPYELSRA